MADGPHGRALRIHAGFVLLFSRLIPGDPGFSGRALGRYSAAILYGTAFGWTFICLNTITGHFYGPAAFPRLSGMLLVIAAVFCSPAGFLGGKVFDTYHSYKLAFELNSLVAAAGIFALFFARMPVPPGMKTIAE